MAQHRARPRSPHLFTGPFRLHYRWGAHMLVSILNRAMGVSLATLGMATLAWWLTAIAAGKEAYRAFLDVASGVPGQIVLIGLSFALFFHMAAGIRHFVMDMGAGFELKSNRFWSMATIIVALFATAGMWLLIYARGV